MKIFKLTLLGAAILVIALSVFAQTGYTKKDSPSGEVVALTKKDFLEKIYNFEKNKDRFVYEGNLPCIIDFYADWCAPCKKVEPILKELAKEYKGKVNFYKINTDNEKELARFFRINSIPTYFFIPANGNPQSYSGAIPRESFVEVITEFLLKITSP